MPFAEAARIALGSLRANKLRSFLTVLGILIGVSSVIAVVAITEGLDRYIAKQVLELGSNSFTVQKMPDIITSHQQWQEMSKRKDITPLPEGMLDGIVAMEDSLLIASWKASAIYKGKLHGTFEVVVPNVKSPADIGFDKKRSRVLVPHFNEDVVEAYEIK